MLLTLFLIKMQDKSFLGLLEKCQTHNNIKSLQSDMEKIIQILILSEKESSEKKNTEYGSEFFYLFFRENL
jgi:hypothetical protein